MAARKRLYLTGRERAEFEHVFGPLVVDQSDPRFVLVTEEEEQRIKAHPHGIPARPHGQDPVEVAKVGAVLKEAAEERGDEHDEPDLKLKDDGTVEVNASRGDSAPDEPKGRGAKSTRVAASGSGPGGSDVSA